MFIFLKKPLKDFPLFTYSSYSLVQILTICINNVQAMLLQSERLLEMHSLAIWRLDFKIFSFSVHHGDTSRRQQTKGNQGLFQNIILGSNVSHMTVLFSHMTEVSCCEPSARVQKQSFLGVHRPRSGNHCSIRNIKVLK